MKMFIFSLMITASFVGCKPPSAPSSVTIDKKPATNSSATSGAQTASTTPGPTNPPDGAQQPPLSPPSNNLGSNQLPPNPNGYQPQGLPVVTIPPMATPDPRCQQASQVQKTTGWLGALQGLFTGNYVNAIGGAITAVNAPKC